MVQTRPRKAGYLLRSGIWILALCLLLLFPPSVSAHAILLRSNPPIGSVLNGPPTRVQMWFNERLDPTFTTARVVNLSQSAAQHSANKETRVDLNDAHLVSNDAMELELTLRSNLPPAVYLVFYRAQSAIDGHIVSDSFLFTVANPNGVVPTYTGALPPPPLDDETPGSPGQSDQSSFLSALMITLVELGVVFWVGAQLWMTFVIDLTEAGNQEQQTLYQEVVQRFDRLFSIPTLLLLLLANIGVLIGQALVVTGGQWLPALAPSLLSEMVATGQFGTYWIMREIVISLAFVLAIVPILSTSYPRILVVARSWANLGLGLLLLLAMALSGHAAAVDNTVVIASVLIDWLHLLAAALWIGGMFYLATAYLPLLERKPLQEQVSALLTTLSRYSPLAITGVIIMAISGPSNAAVHVPTWEQLLTTAYGRTLIIKILLVGVLLCISAVHVFVLRPRLKKTYRAYISAVETTNPQLPKSTAQQVKVLERRMQQQANQLISTLRWEPLFGVAVLICTGLLTIFAGTLQPTAASQTPVGVPIQQQEHVSTKPFTATVKTTDGHFTLQCTVSPDEQGPNVFTVRVFNAQSRALIVNISITIPGMDMGINTINLSSDSRGSFSGNGRFSMSGNWQIAIVIRTPDSLLHTAQISLPVP